MRAGINSNMGRGMSMGASTAMDMQMARTCGDVQGDACARGGGRPRQWQEPFAGDGGDDGEGKTAMDKNGA
eukprot:3769826-Alexandrium_andersonii.AAC.1